MDPKLTADVWRHLITGTSLEGLGFPMTNGRIDLRGLIAPEPSVLREYITTYRTRVEELANLVEIRGVAWKGIDFSNGRLDSLRFFDCRIENCSFDNAKCQDWRMWGTAVTDTTFRLADLRKSALGGVENGKTNSFHRVDFTKADLRQTAHGSAVMVQCTFSETNLSKVDFQGTIFVNSQFAGELNEVVFCRQAWDGAAFPPNEMKGVDFRHAKLRHVEFRELDMSDVVWPVDDEHIIVNNYLTTLDRVLAVLRARSDMRSKKLAALLGNKRKWAGPNQKQGVISQADLIEAGGENAVTEFLHLGREMMN